VVTKDVPRRPGPERGEQTEKPGWAERFRDVKQARKKAARNGAMSDPDDQKRAAGEAAAALVEAGMVVGLGTGSTAAWFVALWRRASSRLIGVPTSQATADLAREPGPAAG
jgi:DeoR/GlpR family transcriptional regulator of sugar metabolism